MKYIFLNIKNLVRNEKFIFIVMIICIFSSAWIMTFSYGLYQNYHAMKNESSTDSKEIYPEIANGETLTQGDIKNYINALSEDLLSEMNVIVCTATIEYDYITKTVDEIGGNITYSSNRAEDMVVSRFTVRGGIYKSSDYIADIWQKRAMVITGHFITDEEEAEGVRCAMVCDEWINNPSYANLMVNNDAIILYGERYSIVGTHSSNGIVVPFLSLPLNTELSSFGMSFENAISRKSYDELKQAASLVLPGKLIFPELPFSDEESIYIYNNIMLISVLIAVLSVINFALLYDFIFKKRRRQIAIMQICGCTPARSWGICLGECFVICVPVFLLGIFTYIPFMKGFLSDIFIFMENSYNSVIYAAVFAIYLIVMLVIMGVKLSFQINKTLSEAQKKGVG